MAKYGRFDPRNKKRGRHKAASIEKNIRIKGEKIKNRYVLSPSDMVEFNYNEGEMNDKRIEESYPY